MTHGDFPVYWQTSNERVTVNVLVVVNDRWTCDYACEAKEYILSLQSLQVTEELHKSPYTAGRCEWFWSPSIGRTGTAFISTHIRSQCVGLVSIQRRQNQRPSSGWRWWWPCRHRRLSTSRSLEVSVACFSHCKLTFILGVMHAAPEIVGWDMMGSRAWEEMKIGQ